jgi:glycosyltransferase involved in cell wall biosynthesis
MFLYRKASAIVSVTHAFRDTLMRRGVDGAKIQVITNGVDISRFNPRAKDAALLAQHGLTGKFVVGYIGTHGLAHALDTLLDAAKALKASPDGDRFRFLLLGDGANKSHLTARAKAENLDNVIFVDSVAKDEVVRYWSILDASIIHLKKTDLFTTVIPSKLFECMGMAIPVLHGVQGESADIVRREDVGLTFEPENAQALIDVVRQLAQDEALCARLKANGPIAARRYDRGELALGMLRVLENVARGR